MARSAEARTLLGTLLWLLHLHAAALYLFTAGFLLTHVELRDVSLCGNVADAAAAAPEGPRGGRVGRARADFAVNSSDYGAGSSSGSPWVGSLPIFQQLVQHGKNPAAVLKSVADPPTTSLQRLKGLTTGGLPTFVDVGDSFGAPAVTEDQLISQAAELVEEPGGGERFILPGLTSFVGSGNQAVEFVTAATIARILNRTLCLLPFFAGPLKHHGGLPSSLLSAPSPQESQQTPTGFWDVHYGFHFEERYDAAALAQFVRVATVEACAAACDSSVDALWRFRMTSTLPPIPDWNISAPAHLKELKWSFLNWVRPADVTAALGAARGRCTLLTGTFPGLRWRGPYLAIARYLQPSRPVARAAAALQAAAFGSPHAAFMAGRYHWRSVGPCLVRQRRQSSQVMTKPPTGHDLIAIPNLHLRPPPPAFTLPPFLRFLWPSAVHWRFDERPCGNVSIGLCFARCEDGANPNDPNLETGVHEWTDLVSHGGCIKGSHSKGVHVALGDVTAALLDEAAANSLQAMYIATDGWLRGPDGCRILGLVINELRQRGLRVAGLWRCPDLPPMPDGSGFNSTVLGLLMGLDRPGFQPGNHVVSQIEQELCTRADVFVGSGQSTWSLGVWRQRMGLREMSALRRRLATSNLSGPNGRQLNDTEMDAMAIAHLLDDDRMAGLVCKNSRVGRKWARDHHSSTSLSQHSIAEEQGPDKWLDFLACEARLNKGGTCKAAATDGDARAGDDGVTDGVGGGGTEDVATAAAAAGGQQFLVPILTPHVGSGNQEVEFVSAAVMARVLNRTLCLSPFFSGPNKHFGPSHDWNGHYGFEIGERHNLQDLQRFVRIASHHTCAAKCNRRLEAYWALREESHLIFRDFEDPSASQTRTATVQMDWQFLEWSSPADIVAALGDRQEGCAAVGGLFPGLRWRGPYLAISPFLQASRPISRAASQLQARALGTETGFMAVHWRFEETMCIGLTLGLCFIRCDNGANVDDPAFLPKAHEWTDLHSHGGCPRGSHHTGVQVARDDLTNAIIDEAAKHGLSSIYIATDGWLRGDEGCRLLATVVLDLRATGLKVAGLWNCDMLASFPDGTTPDLSTVGAMLGLDKKDYKPGNHVTSLIEQELAARADVFLGSGQSTWSLAVWRARAGKRAAHAVRAEVVEAAAAEGRELTQKEADDAVVTELLQDDRMAGLACGNRRFRQHAHEGVAGQHPLVAEGGPDNWLDFLACEARLEHGGKCKVALCW
eukprot:SM000010S04354  [mRNA]  locus=s10:1095085:1106203:+ [translate_table: standard]